MGCAAPQVVRVPEQGRREDARESIPLCIFGFIEGITSMKNVAPQNEVDQAPAKVDAVGKVESYGIEYIPDEDRHSRPRNLLWILFGGSMTFGIIVIGWIPVSLGLGWWASASAIVVGSAIGATLMAPMGLLGLRSGSNNPVASGAHFGALGRMIGSALGITADIVFAALCIWAAGEVLARSVVRIFSVESETMTVALLVLAYTLVAVVMTVIAVMGHANMVSFTKWMVPTAGAMMILYVFVAAPNFDPGYAGGDYVLGSFWPTWILGMLACAGTVNSYGPYAGDWTRHISTKKYPPSTLRRGGVVRWVLRHGRRLYVRRVHGRDVQRPAGLVCHRVRQQRAVLVPVLRALPGVRSRYRPGSHQHLQHGARFLLGRAPAQSGSEPPSICRSCRRCWCSLAPSTKSFRRS